MKKLLILLLVLPMASGYSQNRERLDSLLLNERTMDRPLITHSGQMRLSLDYAFSGLNSRFDEDKNKVKLSEQGSTGIQHGILLGFEYGISNSLQISALLDYESTTLREQSVNILTLDPNTFEPNPPLNISETRYIYGIKDLLLNLDFMVPLKTSKLDLIFSGGISVPASPAGPREPEIYVFDLVTNGTVLSHEVEYYHDERNSNGALTALLGGKMKYRLDDMAFSAIFTYRLPTKESESVYWNYSNIWTGEFQYQSTPFAFLPGKEYMAQFEVEYQLYPFVNLFLDYNLYGKSGGWSEQSGNRVGARDTQLHQLNPGIEILLSSKFWLRQRFVISVAGENTFAPVSFETRLIYNLFPF